jgi:hypothetical protein
VHHKWSENTDEPDKQWGKNLPQILRVFCEVPASKFPGWRHFSFVSCDEVFKWG